MISASANPVGRKLLSGSALRLINLSAAAVASFFLMPFIVHHLGDRIYGFWSLASAFIGYYNLLDLGLSSAISQHLCVAIGRKDPGESRSVFNTALRLQLLIGLAALLVTVLLAAATPWFSHTKEDADLFRKAILILGVNAALGFPARVYWAVLEAELRFDVQSWLANLGLVLRTGLIVWAILNGGGLVALAWVSLFATLPVTALQVWFARKEASWARFDHGHVDRRRIRSFFSYSVYSFLAYVADVVRFQFDPLVISAFIGLAGITHYKVAGVLAQYYLQIICVSVGMLLPVLSRLHGAGDRKGLEGVFFFGTKLSCCLSVFIFAVLAGWGKPFIAKWMGPQYEDGYWPLVVLSLGVLVDVCQRSSADLLFATFKHQGYAWSNCAEAVLNLGFSVALAKPLGILGVALGTFIGAFVIRVIVQPWWVCRVSGLNYLSYVRFLVMNLFRCGCVALAAVLVVAWGIRPSYPWLAASAACATLVYAAGAWLFILGPADRRQFLTALRIKRNLDRSSVVATGEAVM